MVVAYLRRVSCPRAEGGAYNSTGRGAHTCNTFQALLCPEGSKAPIPSFPGSTFPTKVQGMVLEAAVDLNVLSYPIPIIMREQGEVVRQDETSPWISSEARFVLRCRVRRRPVLIPRVRSSPSLRGRARRSLSLSPRVRWSWPKGVGLKAETSP